MSLSKNNREEGVALCLAVESSGAPEGRNLCNPKEEFFTRRRVKDILAQPVASSRELLKRIRQQVLDFVGTAPRSDDHTMLAVQRD